MRFAISQKLFYPLCAALLLFCAACDQDPIFYAISQEVKPRPPKVAGTPSAMVEFYRQYENPKGVFERVPVAYIATATRLHWYAKPDNWNRAKGQVSQPGGKGNIIGLAADDDYLYALYQKQLKRIKWDSAPNAAWKDVAIAADAQTIVFDTIFSSNNRIFIGGRLPERPGAIPCAILYVYDDKNVDADEKVQLLESNTHLLRGVAFNGTSHFLCVNNLLNESGSIFKLDDSSFPAPASGALGAPLAGGNHPFTGIISLEDGLGGATHNTIVAINRSGTIYTINDTGDSFTSTGRSIGRSTGALALWRNPESDEWNTWVSTDPSTRPRPALLLAGFQGELVQSTDTGYTNGYFELELIWKNDKTLDIASSFTYYQPGELGVSTVDNKERYLSTIGKYPISSFFQAPRDIDDNMTLFASTVNEGLWSYRSWDGELQWNAE